MKSIKIKLDEKTIEVKKIPIGKYVEIFSLIKQLPKHLKDFENKDSSMLIEAVPSLVAAALPDFIEIVKVACSDSLTEEEVDSLGLSEVVDIVIGLMEVNNYMGIFDNVKKVLARKDQAAEVLKA